MEQKTLYDLFVKTVQSEMTQEALGDSVKEIVDSKTMSELYRLSKRHDLAHIVSAGLRKSGLLVNSEYEPLFVKEEYLAVYRYERMKYVYDQVCDIFGKSGISYVPLKGSVIRPFYPEGSMRTSCDIDILIREEQLDKAVAVLLEQGFFFEGKNYHDVSLFYSDNIHLELHFSIKENTDSLDRILECAWENAILIKNCQYSFTKEFFIFYLFAHISYHFVSGGCGFRSILDIWIVKHKMGMTYLDSKELLEKAGIFKFAEKISKLADDCFVNQTMDGFDCELLAFVFEGGAYGSTENEIMLSKAKNGTTFKYVINRLFLPYGTMRDLYPVLKRLPVLLPLFWLIRAVNKVIKGKSCEMISEIKTVHDMPKLKMTAAKELCNKLGL